MKSPKTMDSPISLLPSLPESYRTVKVPSVGSFLKRMFAFIGPGYLIAVGYMDPGNWATDLAGGSSFGYSLLWVVLLSNLMAILLQTLSCRLGIVTGRDLAQACRDHYSKPWAIGQWILCEIAICAADLAEVLGTAIALQLLFGIPMLYGVLITALDVLVILALKELGFRYLEAFVAALIIVILVSFGMVLALSNPVWGRVALGLIPKTEIFTQPGMLYCAIGILGATVMPHNLYLHSSVIQTRRYSQDEAGKRGALRFATIDVIIALTLAFFINAAILITCGTLFHAQGAGVVNGIEEAYQMLTPALGVSFASTLFGIALLASGQSSAVTTTLAGQIVMEGFTHFRIAPWARRLLTRSIAILPAFFITLYYGQSGTTKLLVFSQVVLSLQLPFAIVPLLRFTSDKTKMGVFAISTRLKCVAWIIALMIIGLNLCLLAFQF